MDRFRVTQGEQRSDSFAALFNEIQRKLDTAAILQLNFFQPHRIPGLKCRQDFPPQPRLFRKNLSGMASQHLAAGPADKSFGGGADQHRLEVAGEQHHAVLKIGHHLVKVFLQGGEDLFYVAHLASQTINLGGHYAIFIGAPWNGF